MNGEVLYRLPADEAASPAESLGQTLLAVCSLAQYDGHSNPLAMAPVPPRVRAAAALLLVEALVLEEQLRRFDVLTSGGYPGPDGAPPDTVVAVQRIAEAFSHFVTEASAALADAARDAAARDAAGDALWRAEAIVRGSAVMKVSAPAIGYEPLL